MTWIVKNILRFVLLLAIISAAIFFWRVSVVEAAVKYALSSRGLDDTHFEVTKVGWRETVIENVSLAEGALKAQSMRLNYDPAKLISGRLRDLRIENFRLDAGAKWYGHLSRLEKFVSGRGGPNVVLPKIQIENAVINIGAPTSVEITLDGELNISDEVVGGRLEVGVDLAHTSAAFTVQSDSFEPAGIMKISGGGKSDLAEIWPQGFLGLTMTDGRAMFELRGTAKIPKLGEGWAETWQADLLSLNGELRLSEAKTDQGTTVSSTDVDWTVRTLGNKLQLDLTHPATLIVQGVFGELLPAFNFPATDSAAQELTIEVSSPGPAIVWSPEEGGGKLEIVADFAAKLAESSIDAQVSAIFKHDASLHISSLATVEIRASAKAISISGANSNKNSAFLNAAFWDASGSASSDGQLDLIGRLTVDTSGVNVSDFKADTVGVQGDVRLLNRAGVWSLVNTQNMTIVLEGVEVPGELRVEESVLLNVDRFNLSGNGSTAQADVSANFEQAFGTLLNENISSNTFENAAGRLELEIEFGDRFEGEARIKEIHLEISDEEISLSKISAILPFNTTGDTEKFAISGEARDISQSDRFPPVQFDLTGVYDSELISVSGTLETLDQKIKSPIDGSVDLAGRSASFVVGVTNFTFSKNGLQPADLSPTLSEFRNVVGVVNVQLTIGFSNQTKTQSEVILEFDNISAKTKETEITGLSGTVEFSQLLPLATAEPQQLQAQKIVIGVSVSNPKLKFTIPPESKGVSIIIHEASGEIADGKLAIKRAIWNSWTRSNSVDVRVSDISIERLLREWKVKGISGTGRLSGLIPVRFHKSDFSIVDGRLLSKGTGVIRVDWGAARNKLVNSGDQVKLAVEALEDFRYTSLSAKIDGSRGGELTLAIGLDGANPVLLDGYPFRFNINLAGKLLPILEAVRAGRQMGGHLLRSSLSSSK